MNELVSLISPSGVKLRTSKERADELVQSGYRRPPSKEPVADLTPKTRRRAKTGGD